MEQRAAEVGAPPLHYMFPDNGGLNAADAQRAVQLGLPVARIMPDLHVGAGGAVEAAASLFANPPISGFNQSAINCETNAGTHDMRRALDEAADLLDWFTADTSVTDRYLAVPCRVSRISDSMPARPVSAPARPRRSTHGTRPWPSSCRT